MRKTLGKGTASQYGRVLKEILQERNISITAFAQKLELTSRNTVHRIIAGSSKLESVERLHRQICENYGRLNFSQKNIQQLEAALDCFRYGEQGHALRKVISSLILDSGNGSSHEICVCLASNVPKWCGQPIEALLSRLAADDEVDILLLNAYPLPLLRGLAALLDRAASGGCHCTVRHFLQSAGDDVCAEIQQFIWLHDLMGNPHYACYRAAAESGERPYLFSAEHSMIICKRDKKGIRTVDRVSFMSNTAFTYCADLPDDDGALTAYYAECTRLFITQSDCINLKTEAEQMITQMLALNAEFAHYECCWSQILIKPDLCISQIPTKYMMRLIRDSGYLGLSPGAPEIKEFERVHRQRYDNFASGKHGYVFIFSESGMRRFMETGRLSDHVPMLPAFTVEERREIIEGLLSVWSEKPGIVLHMLRKNVQHADVIINLFDDRMMYLSKAYSASLAGWNACRILEKHNVEQVRSAIQSLLLSEHLLDMEKTRQNLVELCRHM